MVFVQALSNRNTPNRILLIQPNSSIDPKNGERYTVKRYHATRQVDEKEDAEDTDANLERSGSRKLIRMTTIAPGSIAQTRGRRVTTS